MLTREEIRKTDADKLITNKKTEKANFEKLKNKVSEKAENCIIRMTERIRK